MTQALLNSLNNINETVNLGSVRIGSAQTENSNGSDFQQVLDSKNDVLSTDSSLSTIGDMKNPTTIDDKANKFSELKKILSQAFQETNEESALDLTLARDINEIISQLKGELDELKSSDDTLTTDEETEDTTEKTMLFEQVMAGLDKALGYTQTQELNVDMQDDSQTITNEVIDLVSETVSDDDAVQTTVSDGENIEDIVDEDILKELNIESIEADADSGDFQDDSLMSKQTVEEHAIKAMLDQDAVAFDVKMDKALESQNVQAQAKPVEVTPSKIMEQITKQMDGLYNNSKVNIVLNPESLGKINIQLMNSKEGLTAQFTVTTPEARDLLMKGIDGLKETLTAHGVGVDNVSVKLNDTQKSDNNQNWTEQDGSRGGNKGQGQPNREEKEKGLFEKMMAQTDKNENGNV